MANARTANKIYIDSTGSVISSGPIKVAYILFTPDASNDELLLHESASGSNCIYLREKDAKQTHIYDFSAAPAVFMNGLYVQTITSGARAVIITTGASGG